MKDEPKDEQKEVEELINYWQVNRHAYCESGSPRDRLAINDMCVLIDAIESGYFERKQPSAGVMSNKEWIAERLLQWIPKRVDAYKMAEEICSKLSPKPPAINWPEKLNDECTGHEDGICNCDFGYVNGWNACLSACKEAVKQAGLN